MNLKREIINLAIKNESIKTIDVVGHFKNKYSRGYISRIINELVKDNKLLKGGSTAGAFYVLPERKHLITTVSKYRKKVLNKDLEEHIILSEIQEEELYLKLKDNVKSIFDYAFSEMLNNAIDHSQSKEIKIEVARNEEYLEFIIEDYGVGVFRNIQKKKRLNSELEAVQDLLKGKTTTQPQAHSGEGIFFTSKISDVFSLGSFDFCLIINNEIKDTFFGENVKKNKGTRVIFKIALNTKKHLIDIFKKFQSDQEEMSFDKTEILVKLFTMGTIYVSRSQARRVLSGLDKFKYITLDFDKVPMIGQGFADEIFRVYKIKHPEIKIKFINVNEAVEFMIKRVAKPK